MTIDEFVINLAREAGLGTSLTHNGGEPRVWIEGADWHDELTRFAALVRNAVLEECASEFEGQYTDSCPGTNISAAIRAMKENCND